MMNYLGKLLGDAEIAGLLGSEKDIEAMVRFELSLTRAQAAFGLIPRRAADEIQERLSLFRLDEIALTAGTFHDGVVVPELIRQMRELLPQEFKEYLHFGTTSQDVIDTAFAIKMGPVFFLLEERLADVLTGLDVLVGEFGSNIMMGRTRMQKAMPIHVLDRLMNWRGPLQRAFDNLAVLEQSVKIISLAGAVGTSEKLGPQEDMIRHAMAEDLVLSVPDYIPHTQRDRMVDLANWLSLVTGALGKIGQDIALMAQNEIAEIEISGTGGSSAMPHKQNPVLAETLVTLARFNAVQVSGLHHAMIHEQERSGAAWTLEWMIMPQMLEATGAALSHALKLLESIVRMGTPATPNTAN